jgi:hypothetical protein
MTPETIRTVLGEFFNFLKKIAIADDATTVEKWNVLPENLRELIVAEAGDSIEDLKRRTLDDQEQTLKRINEALARVNQISNVTAPAIEVEDDNFGGMASAEN